MIELVFNDSVKAAMAIAKSDAKEDKNDVESLWLDLDAGDLKGLPDIECRKKIIFSILRGPECICDEYDYSKLWDFNLQALNRILAATKTGEGIRIWWSDCPAEMCGFFFTVNLLAQSDVHITHIKLPSYLQQSSGICVYDGFINVAPEHFFTLLPLEKEVNISLRYAIAQRWDMLVKENAPLRAVVNGHLHSVPIDFYDHFLRKSFTDRIFSVASAIGKTMGLNQLGVRDWWYAQRIRSMIENGELEITEANNDFYKTMIRRKQPV